MNNNKNTYICIQNCYYRMKQLKQISLSQLSRILKDENYWLDFDNIQMDQDQLMSEYLSKHLLVARNPPVGQFLSKLSEEAFLLPEMRVMVLTHGSATPIVNLTPHRFEAGQLIFLSQNSIVQAHGYSDDIQGFGLSLTDEIIRLLFPNDMPKLMDGHVRDCCFSLSAEELRQVEDLHTLLYNMIHSEQKAPLVVLNLAAAFLWQADYLWNRHENDSRNSLSREQRLFTDFVQLVSRYATQEHNIDFYAQRLFLSPRYMSTLVKQVSGKAAKQWIDDAIITRIKVELRHSNKSAAEIAEKMNFANPSFFCKYFKRMTGMTTQAYREGK